ncbi:MAG TPA: hypothetical protein VMM84_18410 [Pyrinomonadaceae bacterium]|nr:hypothetical protein [Pyrinomonadaceae bacterium]
MSQPKFRVSKNAPLGLFLRSEPVVKDNTKIAVLPMGHVVAKLAESETAGWWEVSTTIDGANIKGFVSSKFLVPNSEFEAPPSQSSLSAVHLHANTPVTRKQTRWAFALNEAGQPTRNSSSPPNVKAKELGSIIKWLDVQNKARYLPKPSATYCNIYGYDYCYLAGVYLPRVWWNNTAIAKLKAGKSVSPIINQTVSEIRANGLFDWLREHGLTFGWRRSFNNLTELQNAANDGQVVVILAQHKIPNLSGHIAVVAPETSTQKALRNGSTLIRPLQSQAGRTNRSYWTPPSWWSNSQKYKDFGFWINGS